ncbi:MAG: (deoxy)nucleoside triphosphate pyrophosphohydrolase [Synergistaceae bacterium]|nr:(deoxy)nucleoside triphosphate pyrophosphohydrolase [Synergistaceae bacterium]
MLRVSAAIINNSDNEILICQRGQGGSCEFLWEFPGGKIEPSESPEECLIRECREELEIDIEIDALFAHTSYSYPEREFEFLFFRASMTDGVPLASVHNCIKWVSPDMLEKYEFCPADVFVVEKLSKGK